MTKGNSRHSISLEIALFALTGWPILCAFVYPQISSIYPRYFTNSLLAGVVVLLGILVWLSFRQHLSWGLATYFVLPYSVTAFFAFAWLAMLSL